MARILVTGGRGFIGTNLTAELRSRGNEVWTSDLVQAEDPLHAKADCVSYQQMEALFQGHSFDYVFHLAAEYGRWNGEDHYENLWRTNVIGTKNLLRLQERHGFKLVFFSSAEVYGDFDGLMTESIMDTVAIRQLNDYAISKWAGELQCLNHEEMFGAEIVRVRPVGCYGPHEYYSPYRGVIPIFVYRALTCQPFTVHAGHRRIFDYVTDTCRTAANIVDNFQAGEAYNVGSKEDWDMSIEDLADIVIAETGAPAHLAEPAESERHTTRAKIVDYSKARRDLDHNPKVEIEEGIHRYTTWARTVYDLGPAGSG